MEAFFTFLANNAVLTGVWLVLFGLIIFTSIKIKLSPIKQLSTQELTFSVNKENAVVVDIRSENDFRKQHIIDSLNCTSEKINKGELASLEKYKDRPIIVVCAQGISASKAANQLAKAGFSQVNLLKGGMNAWVSAGLPTVKK
ncbi:rhodanese-like domain-containing protein [Thalassotalea sp. LPB0316]|uniref:rhodanese-like domain-containing protein n=1 Tax=Thalassotalea sp. LPB0316 TaxID=2769490 RepID=UPI0018685B95|nr:rhodanese-like domain-containing protein [Thalassotalea sp. LPB0316]QOL26515.1 rhodanese-like domain-containing protein [Thalassotalea sp. LPB0316]